MFTMLNLLWSNQITKCGERNMKITVVLLGPFVLTFQSKSLIKTPRDISCYDLGGETLTSKALSGARGGGGGLGHPPTRMAIFFLDPKNTSFFNTNFTSNGSISATGLHVRTHSFQKF